MQLINKGVMHMRWSEFKKLVDKELKHKDPVIDYIDVIQPDNNHPMTKPEVYIDPIDGEMVIS